MATNERVVNGIKTRVLHNKDYVEVAERVRIVHQVSDKVEMLESAPFQVADHWLWKVAIRVNGNMFIGNAEVKLNAPKNTPDGTNPFECAETSAYGRAIANAGLGTVDSIASYDEVARALPKTTVQAVERGVIDSASSQKRIEKPALDPDIKERLNSLYPQAKELHLFPVGKTDAECVAAFLKFVSALMHASISSPSHLTDEDLDMVEAHIAQITAQAS